MDKVLFSSKKLDWETPVWLMDHINELWAPRTVDVCANKLNTKCEEYMDQDIDALVTEWPGGHAFMNPPYGSCIRAWIQRAAEQTWEGNVIDTVALIPSRTDTRYWHDYVMRAAEICFLRGRIKFVGAPSSAPFPSCLVHFVSAPVRPVITSLDIRSIRQDAGDE